MLGILAAVIVGGALIERATRRTCTRYVVVKIEVDTHDLTEGMRRAQEAARRFESAYRRAVEDEVRSGDGVHAGTGSAAKVDARRAAC